MTKFYVTTAIDYTDDVIHIGHAYQKIVADVYARYHRLLGDEVFFLTGTDEHGQKSEKPAKEAGIDPRTFVDEVSRKDRIQLDSLNISYDRFIRTTDSDHIKVVEEFWQKVKKAGDIYLGNYTGLYCEGCEGFVTEKDLTDGKCPYHPGVEIKALTEKNYFFRWSKYENFLREHIRFHPEFVLPESRKNEMLSFLEQGLEDIPISRPTVSWGIPVPGDSSQTIYVWFDALINYLTGVPKGFWPADLHLLGKDNIRWHALLWPAMLKSAKYKLPKTVYAHGFISLGGKKISKSLGNIIRPSELVEKFGVDAVRYYLLKVKNLADDGDLSMDRLIEVYNADLANGLGNLVSRVLKLVEKNCAGIVPKIEQDPDSHPLRVADSIHNWKKSWKDLDELLPKYRPNEVLESIWKFISEADRYIDQNKPWELAKTDEGNFNWVIYGLLDSIHQLAWQIYPFMPSASRKIAECLNIQKLLVENPLNKDSWTNIEPGIEIKIEGPLFPRIGTSK